MTDKDLSCVICHDIFREPVVLQCSHSFCKDCLQSWWSAKQIKTCPLCSKLSFSRNPPCNLALKNLCETFLLERHHKASAGSEPLCDLHFEKLRLFCLDHQELVCVVCRDSREHTNHRFTPINEAAQDHKQQLLRSLKPLKDNGTLLEQTKENFDKTAVHVKIQVKHTEKEIREQFKKLHQFLEEEEETRITALREEEKCKSKVIMEKVVSLSNDIAVFSNKIKAIEENMKAADTSFLQNYKTAAESVQQCLLVDVPQPVSGVLIDVAKHLGNLTFQVWTKMKDLVKYTPVILDPNTAYPHLVLSEDLSSVRLGQKQRLPDNPERFDQHFCVLSSEGFTSGFHSWDVEVKNEKIWGVGVVKESVQRQGNMQTGYWEVSLLHGKYSAVSPPLKDKVLPVEKLQNVRVQLDWDRGRLSFFDLNTNKLIHTFKLSSSEKLIPYICTHNELPLSISPVSISATVNHAAPVPAGFWW